MSPRTALLAVALSAGFATCSSAEEPSIQPIPRLNPIAFCKMYATGSGVFSRDTFNDCMDREQKSYDKLKGEWANVEPGARITCLGPKGTDEAYFGLEFCIRHESAAINKPAPRFQY